MRKIRREDPGKLPWSVRCTVQLNPRNCTIYEYDADHLWLVERLESGVIIGFGRVKRWASATPSSRMLWS